ncbi:hypothetical protein ACF0H5_005372 [Mactra antiquata]
MCIKLLVVYILSSITIDVCVADRIRSINVTKETCGTKYNMTTNDRLILSYDGEKDFEMLHPPCVLSMVNIMPGHEICVQLQSRVGSVDTVSCGYSLKYFIGYLPKDLRYSFACNGYKRKPLCTEKNNVYAVFVDKSYYYKLDPYEIAIFTRIKPTTTTERWRTTPYQTVYGFTAKPKPTVSSTAVFLLVISGLVVLTIVCVCCKLSHVTKRQANASQSPVETEQQNTPLSNNRYSSQQTNMHNTHQPARQINEAPAPRTVYNGAPSYEDVVWPSAPVISESNESNDISTPGPYFNQSNGSWSSSQDESDSSTSIELDRQTANEEPPSCNCRFSMSKKIYIA